MTMALIAGAVSSAIKGGTKAYGEYGTAQDLKLTEEQRKRLRELERLQAEDALGMSTGQREQYRSQAMSPVQTAEREALARFGAAQSVADIGQGASFRQQQALKQASENARAEVSRSVAERDAQVAQQQSEEKARLETQQNQSKALERQAALSLVGGVAEGALEAVQIGAEHKYQEQLYDKRLKDLRGGQAVTSQGAQSMLGISPQMEAVEKTKATTQSLGGDANRFVDNMIPATMQQDFSGSSGRLAGSPLSSVLKHLSGGGIPRDTYEALLQNMLLQGY